MCLQMAVAAVSMVSAATHVSCIIASMEDSIDDWRNAFVLLGPVEFCAKK